jgi:hypothetical protein
MVDSLVMTGYGGKGVGAYGSSASGDNYVT